MSAPVCVEDIKKLGENNLTESSEAWKFLSGGAMLEQTLRDNVKAFERYRLRPRVLVDVSQIDLSTSLLGAKINFPVCVAPFSVPDSPSPVDMSDRPCAIAKAAESAGVVYTMNMWNNSEIEDAVAAAPTTPKWLQIYIYKNREMVKRRILKAESSGFHAIVVTVDSQVEPQRYTGAKLDVSAFSTGTGLGSDIYRSFEAQGGSGKPSFSSFIDPSINWSDIAWIKSLTNLPIVLKGIVTAEMAREALRHGISGIFVSNHGGRKLDGTPASIDALPEVVRAVNGRCEVYLDGGVRTGTDVLKAIALGAKAVFVGRPILWGLAYKGQEGVEKVLQMLRQEFKTSMQLMGCTSIEDLQLGDRLVVHESYYRSQL